MHTYAFITGSNPGLSLEELLSVVGPLGHVVDVQRDFFVVQGSLDPARLLGKLGGTVKICRQVQAIEDWKTFTKDSWLHMLRSQLHDTPGKFTFGASVYGSQQLKRHIRDVGLELKKHLKSLTPSVRFAWNREGVLSSVAVHKNKLIGKELVVLAGRRYYFCITEAVQDFERYGQRDMGRPARNMERGMLPPKLAQIMLNMAQVQHDDKLLDPFCGGGTVLQEALLMGLTDVWGSDNDAQAIAETYKNSVWLTETYNVVEPHLKVVDAMHMERAYQSGTFDVVVTEPFLGPSRLLKRTALTRKQFQEVADNVRRTLLHFFETLGQVTKPHARAVVVFPVFRLFDQEWYIEPLESFERLGWTLERPKSKDFLSDQHIFSKRGLLLYHRPDQVVTREITVWRRNDNG